MVSKNSTENQGNQQPEIAFLKQIMSFISVLHRLPSEQYIGELASGALEEIPGVDSCCICLRKLSQPIGSLKIDQCNKCQWNVEVRRDVVDYRCKLVDREGFKVISLETYKWLYGFIILSIKKNVRFEFFKPVIKNFSDYVAVKLENLEQLEEIERVNSTLKKEIGNRKLMEEKLKSQWELIDQKDKALKELINQVQKEKDLLKKNVTLNIDKLIQPLINQLRTNKSSEEMKCLSLLEGTLKEITSPFGKVVSNKMLKLTPKEIEICNMIKNGLSSKDIGNLLFISASTVERHRNNIRKKLNLTREKINLVTYLNNIET